ERLWQKMYSGTSLFGRRGVTIAALGAVETALWDIAGKAIGRPVCELIWRSCCTVREPAEIKEWVTPYATIYPPGDSPDEMKKRFGQAAAQGFRAMKLESWEGGFARVDTATDAALARLARGAIGGQCDLMVDVMEYWPDVGHALASIRAMEPSRLHFVE